VIAGRETHHRDNEDFGCNDFTILTTDDDISNHDHITLHRSLLAVFKNRRSCGNSTNEGAGKNGEPHLDRRGCARLKVVRRIDNRLTLDNGRGKEE
jgi:hypothetical protein